MKISVASVVLQALTFLVSTGEALREARRGGQELGPLVDSAETSEVQQTTRYTGVLQEADDNRSKNAGGSSSGSRRHHNSHGTARRQQHHDCNNNDIAECVELLEVLTNKDLGFAATVDELNKMCPVLLDGLQCIDNYTRRCLTQKHRDYFNKLYAGTIRVIKDLCNTRGRYQEEYIRHAPCMRQVNPKYNVCSVTYHQKTVSLNHMQDASVSLSEDEKNRNVIILCCSFQEYLQCSERVVFETCGNETALFTKEFLDRMAGPIVQGQCSLIFNLYPCPRDLFPIDAELSSRPESSTDPSSSPASPPPRGCTAAPQHETASGQAEPQPSILISPAPPAPTPQVPRTLVFTHGTTKRPATTLPATKVEEKAENSATDGASESRAPKMRESAASRDDYASTTVRSRVVLGQPLLDLEAVSLHEVECVAAEAHREPPREHGHTGSPPPSSPSPPSPPPPPPPAGLPSLLVASSLLKLVNLPPARATEHDDTSANGLTHPPASFEDLDANVQSALYSFNFNLSSAYRFPYPRTQRLRPKPRSPAGAARHRPPSRPQDGLSRTIVRATTGGGMASTQRRFPSQLGGLRSVDPEAANTSRIPWHMRHSRRHLRPPHMRRRNFRRRRPLATRTTLDVGQGEDGTRDELESTSRPSGGLEVSVSLDGAPSPTQPDHEQEASTDSLEVTRAEENVTNGPAVNNENLESRPLAAFPRGADEAEAPPAMAHPGVRVGTGRPRLPTGSAGHPWRRHRRPWRRRKFYRKRKPHQQGKLEGVGHRPSWGHVNGPLWAAGRRPTPPTLFQPPGAGASHGQGGENFSDLDSSTQFSDGDQETVLEAVTDGGNTTVTTSSPNTATENETQAVEPREEQPTPTPASTSLPTTEPLEVPTATRDPVEKTQTEPRENPVLLTGQPDELPDDNTQEEIRHTAMPEYDAHETGDATTEPGSSITTSGPSLPANQSTTVNDPTRSSDHLGDDGSQRGSRDPETDALPSDPGSGEGHSPPDELDFWLQNLFLSELREAVIPAPTPIPYTVRLWREHDRMKGAKGFFSSFVPLTLDVVESDFVPLTHPATTTATEGDPISDSLENEYSDATDFGFYFKDGEENFEPSQKEEVTLLPPQQRQASTAATATVLRNNPPNSTVRPTPHTTTQVDGVAAADISDDERTDARPSPIITEAEMYRTGNAEEKEEEDKETEKDKEKKKSQRTKEEENEKEKGRKKEKKKKKAKEEQEAAERSYKSVRRKDKPATSRAWLAISTDDLGGKTRTSPAAGMDRRKVSSPERSSGTQRTDNFTRFMPISPSVSDAANYSHSQPRQRTGGKLNTHTHSHSAHDSLDSQISDENRNRERPAGGAPGRPKAAGDWLEDALLEGETGGASRVGSPLLNAAVAGLLLLAVL